MKGIAHADQGKKREDACAPASWKKGWAELLRLVFEVTLAIGLGDSRVLGKRRRDQYPQGAPSSDCLSGERGERTHLRRLRPRGPGSLRQFLAGDSAPHLLAVFDLLAVQAFSDRLFPVWDSHGGLEVCGPSRASSDTAFGPRGRGAVEGHDP